MIEDQSLILTTGGLAIGTVYLIEWMKRSKLFPFINADTSTLNRVISVLAAGVGALGIHYEWDAASRVLAFTIPTMDVMAHGAWQWFVQWSLQQYVFKTGVKPPPVAWVPGMPERRSSPPFAQVGIGGPTYIVPASTPDGRPISASR